MSSVNTPSFHGRSIVITGASSGFGRGAALDLAKAGASLVLAARRENVLQDLARECEAIGGGRTLPVATDVSKRTDMEKLARTAIDTFGRVDVWINNAGVGAIGRFDEVPLADHVQVIETDLMGTVYGSYFALRQFHRQGSGTLINVASALGKISAPYYASYDAAKHGVVGLGTALRQELRQSGVEDIFVCTVLPMAMDTPFFEHASNYTGHKSVPTSTLHDPQEVIDAIVRLISHPQDEVIVGGGKIAAAAHALAPALVETLLAKQTHKSQIVDAPFARTTLGAVHEPSAKGTQVSGGLMDKAQPLSEEDAWALNNWEG